MSENVEERSFHNTDMALRVAMFANVMSWVILVFFGLSFISTISQVVSQWAMLASQLPTDFLELLMFWVSNVFSSLILGLFAFAAVQGVSQLIYIGVDIYFELVGDEEEEAEAA